MATRKRELSPDDKGRYRPYVGEKIVRVEIVRRPGAALDSLPDNVVFEKKPHRFNLGTDRREAERRYARIRELYEENCRVNGEEVWSDRALEYAKRIAKGEYRIEVPPLPPDAPVKDPVAEYSQILQVDRDRLGRLQLREHACPLQQHCRSLALLEGRPACRAPLCPGEHVRVEGDGVRPVRRPGRPTRLLPTPDVAISTLLLGCRSPDCLICRSLHCQ